VGTAILDRWHCSKPYDCDVDSQLNCCLVYCEGPQLGDIEQSELIKDVLLEVFTIGC